MDTDGEGLVMESGLEVSVWEGVEVGACVGEAAAAVLTVVLPLLETAVTPTFAPEPAAPAPRRGLSSDCWMIFTPSGLLHDDSLVRAL